LTAAPAIELPGPWISDVRSCDIEDVKKALIAALGPDVNLANVHTRLHFVQVGHNHDVRSRHGRCSHHPLASLGIHLRIR